MRYLVASCLIAICFLACSPKKENIKGLPFYNSADFTPEWIAENDSKFKDIHRIADFRFTNQNGKEISNATFAGKIYVANYFFTICPGICPVMTENMVVLQNQFKNEDRVLLLSHTVTPWIDTVEQLKKYAIDMGVLDDKYHLVTGDKNEIYNLARTSYFVEKEIGLETDPDQFLHSENLILIDTKGRIRGIYNGTILKDIDRLETDINTILSSI
jgi:protein SCO1/2